jgi:DNA-binding GntR family transcriptional regulator
MYIVNNRSLTMQTSSALQTPPQVGQSTLRIDRLSKRTLRQHIADRLRAAILEGEITPGSAIIETTLAEKFNVSRGPLREALRQLIEEGLLVTVPYTGTYVTSLSVQDVREIYSIRISLERFAFEQAWSKRNAAFALELRQRHEALTALIDEGDDNGCILAELHLHSLIYEASEHRLLQRMWFGLSGRLQLYWAAHHRAHGSLGPKRDGHDSYIELALGNSLPAMLREVSKHMGLGAELTEEFLSKPSTQLSSVTT